MFRHLPGVCLVLFLAGCGAFERRAVPALREADFTPGWPRDTSTWKDLRVESLFHAGEVRLVDPATDKMLRTIPCDEFVGTESVLDQQDRLTNLQRSKVRRGAPGSIAIAGDRLFVEQAFTPNILVIDLVQWRVIDRLPLGGEGKLCASHDGKHVYFACNLADRFYVIDPVALTFQTIAYPAGSRGIGTIAVSPDDRLLYLGLQRGYRPMNGQVKDGDRMSEGSHLAIYDLEANRYIAAIPLSDGREFPDVSSPASMVFGPDNNILYIGMFQSRAGIWIFDTKSQSLRGNLAFPSHVQYFEWADPLLLATVKDRLVTYNRNGLELVVVDTSTHRILRSFPVPHGESGTRSMWVSRNDLVIRAQTTTSIPLSEILAP